MAVTITKGKGIDHHRNPSGLHNKVLWILSEMKWDANNFDIVKDSVVVDENSKLAKSWKKAFDLAAYLLMPRYVLSSKTCGLAYVTMMHNTWYKKLVDKCHDTKGKIAKLKEESEKFKKIRTSGLEKIITEGKACAGEVRNRMNYVQFQVNRACDQCGKLHKEFWILNDEFVCQDCLSKVHYINEINVDNLAKRVCELQSDCATLKDKNTVLRKKNFDLKEKVLAAKNPEYIDKIAAALQGEVELTPVELKECLEFLYSL